MQNKTKKTTASNKTEQNDQDIAVVLDMRPSRSLMKDTGYPLLGMYARIKGSKNRALRESLSTKFKTVEYPPLPDPYVLGPLVFTQRVLYDHTTKVELREQDPIFNVFHDAVTDYWTSLSKEEKDTFAKTWVYKGDQNNAPLNFRINVSFDVDVKKKGGIAYFITEEKGPQKNNIYDVPNAMGSDREFKRDTKINRDQLCFYLNEELNVSLDSILKKKLAVIEQARAVSVSAASSQDNSQDNNAEILLITEVPASAAADIQATPDIDLDKLRIASQQENVKPSNQNKMEIDLPVEKKKTKVTQRQNKKTKRSQKKEEDEESENKAKKSKIDSHEHKHEQSTPDTKELYNQVEDAITKRNNRIIELENLLKKANEEKTEIENSLRDVERELEESKENEKKLQHTMFEVRTDRKRKDDPEYDTKLAEANGELRVLKLKLDEHEQEMANNKKERESYEIQLKEKEEKIQALNALLEDIENENKELIERINEAQKEKGTKTDVSSDELDAMAATNTELKHELDSTKKKVHSTEEMVNLLREQLEKSKRESDEKISAMEEKLKIQEAELIKFKNENEELVRINNKMTEAPHMINLLPVSDNALTTVPSPNEDGQDALVETHKLVAVGTESVRGVQQALEVLNTCKLMITGASDALQVSFSTVKENRDKINEPNLKKFFSNLGYDYDSAANNIAIANASHISNGNIVSTEHMSTATTQSESGNAGQLTMERDQKFTDARGFTNSQDAEEDILSKAAEQHFNMTGQSYDNVLDSVLAGDGDFERFLGEDASMLNAATQDDSTQISTTTQQQQHSPTMSHNPMRSRSEDRISQPLYNNRSGSYHRGPELHRNTINHRDNNYRDNNYRDDGFSGYNQGGGSQYYRGYQDRKPGRGDPYQKQRGGSRRGRPRNH